MMIVTVAVTALFGHLVSWNQSLDHPEDYLPAFLELEIRFTDDGLSPEGAESLMNNILEKDEVTAVALELSLASQDGVIVWRCVIGEPGIGDVHSSRASQLIDCPGGERLPASYLLTVWHVD